ncbi:hypothetical protein AAFF_G00195610 [Aldrovandia affinis]|uniref:Uncharacterized protein n=1 Tax=Aldrovandia affinis TaxID=143900 RepID=A0AAD7W5H4_9TELE|nr:hypothetical protein AAFF_G00195610 [Aldrovandia affinis]
MRPVWERRSNGPPRYATLRSTHSVSKLRPLLPFPPGLQTAGHVPGAGSLRWNVLEWPFRSNEVSRSSDLSVLPENLRLFKRVQTPRRGQVGWLKDLFRAGCVPGS